ncbi:MAG: pyruvate dehydrogenase (acetyl-transferring) E1 component subunit alpha [Chloroflexi bacterium]|nr:pyruvate dehydrogenase (acetyl-transferring) E1 component subunit alpha [Chloroflexota bacterium]
MAEANVAVKTLEKKELLRLYHEMALVRRLEEEAAHLYQQGKIGGFLHLYIGQEAVASGLLSVRRPEDHVLTAYRDHGVAIACGIEVKYVIAELLGKATGVAKGKGGSMHLADVRLNFWGGYAIVGSHLPLAAGIALADKYKGEPGVTICMFGDGATNIGYFHEALNLSMVWDLPVLWLCENNQYGMGTAVERASAVEEIRQKAEGYGMPNSRINGMDVLEVRGAAEEALGYVRENGTPYFLEVVTYRFQGHSIGDPERYRDKEEVDRWREADPIKIFRKHLIDTGAFSVDDLSIEEERVDQEVAEAVEFAEASPDPPPEALYENIYADS